MYLISPDKKQYKANLHCHSTYPFGHPRCDSFGGATMILANAGETLTHADIKVDKKCRYVRISIADQYGKRADTRGFFRDELGLPPLEEVD